MKTKTASRKKRIEFWMFVAPVFIPFVIFYLIPICMGAVYSLYDWNGVSASMKFVGLRNFVELFTKDPDYFESLGFTFKFAIFNVILTNVLAMLFALWVNGKLKTAKFARTCFFLPNVLCAVVCGFLWRFIFNNISDTLAKSTGITILGTKLLGSAGTAWVAILIVELWQSIGYNMIIYIAGLTGIDASLYESAAIDGAGKTATFFRITLPLLMPSVTICLFNSISNSFRLFDLNVALTKGGPGRSTMGLPMDVYTTAFEQNRMGYGSAKAMILFVIVVIVAMLQIRFTRKREVEM